MNLFFGTYFEDYESIISGFFRHEFTEKMDYSWNTNIYFFLTPTLTFLAYFFDSTQFYSFFTTFLNLISLVVFVYVLLKLLIESNLYFYHKCLILLFFLIISIPQILYVSNRYFTTLLSFSSFLLYYLYSIDKVKYRKYLYFSIIFLIIASFVRFQVVMVFFLISSCFSLFFINKTNTFQSIKYFVLACFFQLAFSVVQHNFFYEYKYIEKAEHEIIDRESTNMQLDKKNISSIFKHSAMKMYIKDDAIFDYRDYEKLVKDVKYRKYFFSKSFLNAFKNKMSDAYEDISKYWYLILLTFIHLIFYLYLRNMISNPKFLRLVFGFSIILLLTLFVFNVFIFFPAKSWFQLLFIINFILVYSLVLQSSKVNLNRYFLFCVFFSMSVAYYGWSVYKFEDEKNKRVEAYRKIMFNEIESNNTIVMANFTSSFLVNSSRLFSRVHSTRINHYYLDLFFYSNYSYYKKHHKDLFGEGLPYLNERIKRISQPNIVFFSNEEYNKFLKEYLFLIHNIEVDFNLKVDTNMPYNVYTVKI